MCAAHCPIAVGRWPWLPHRVYPGDMNRKPKTTLHEQHRFYKGWRCVPGGLTTMLKPDFLEYQMSVWFWFLADCVFSKS